MYFTGSIPGAIIFGLLLDNACVLWNEECGVRGRCHYYDRYKVAISTVLYGVAMKVIAIACFSGALLTYKPSSEAKEEK